MKTPSSKVRPKQASSPQTAPPPDELAQAPKPASRRSLRELRESLSLADQFRLVVVLSVVVSILALQVFMSIVDVGLARHRAIGFARQLSTVLQAQPDGNTNEQRLLLAVAGHSEIQSIVVKLPSGRLVRRYDRDHRSTNDSAQSDDADVTDPSVEPGWLTHVQRALMLAPLVIELPLDTGQEATATAFVSLDQSTFFNPMGDELSRIPLSLPIGFLIALLAANSLKRQILEPLTHLASATRVSKWATSEPPPKLPHRRNELTELASNFDALADRLAEYERDLRNVRLASARTVIEQTREMEQRVRAADAMMRAKDDFLANMSHEIRTPMNGVLGMAELLAGTNLDKRQQRFVDSLRTAAATMMQIINDILDDSKIGAGKMELVCEPFDVRGLMEDVGQLYAGAAEQKKLELICRVEARVPRSVVGDVLRLRQVLGNLVSNAVKYTDQGEIQIRVADDQATDGKWRLHFSVADTGPGIPEAQQAAVFEAFTQLENASRVGGTGLGLSIANRLVKLMGGTGIDLGSEPGRGSTFSFAVPVEVLQGSGPDTTDNGEFRGLRVLLVDDNSSSYLQLEETLNQWSADVTVVNRARIMLERLRSAAQRGSPYDLVLIDHSLPDMTSAEILRAIRTDTGTASTFVVLMSALAFDPDQVGDNIEPDACIAKPVRQDLLRRALQAAKSPGTAAPIANRTSGARADAVALGLEVLVVDDNAVNREVAVAMLEERACKVAIAEDGRTAVARASARRFDVILMDCQMPGMDGYEATAEIRRGEGTRGTAPTPIVALTANVLAKDRDRCLAAGMTAFLSKPFTPAQLVEVLRPIAQERGTLRALAPPDKTPAPQAVAQTASRDAPAAGARASNPAAGSREPVLSEAAVVDMLEPLFESAPGAATGKPASPVLTDVLDREQIQAVLGLGKPAVFERLCDLLFQSAPAALQAIDAALATGDLAKVASTAHSLKSSCANLGGRQLAAQLDRCESAARESGDLNHVRSLAAGLQQNYAAFAAALAHEYPRRTA